MMKTTLVNGNEDRVESRMPSGTSRYKPWMLRRSNEITSDTYTAGRADGVHLGSTKLLSSTN